MNLLPVPALVALPAWNPRPRQVGLGPSPNASRCPVCATDDRGDQRLITPRGPWRARTTPDAAACASETRSNTASLPGSPGGNARRRMDRLATPVPAQQMAQSCWACPGLTGSMLAAPTKRSAGVGQSRWRGPQLLPRGSSMVEKVMMDSAGRDPPRRGRTAVAQATSAAGKTRWAPSGRRRPPEPRDARGNEGRAGRLARSDEFIVYPCGESPAARPRR